VNFFFHVRVESSHWKLNYMLGYDRGDLCKCLEGRHNNLRLQLGNIIASFHEEKKEAKICIWSLKI